MKIVRLLYYLPMEMTVKELIEKLKELDEEYMVIMRVNWEEEMVDFVEIRRNFDWDEFVCLR